MEQRGRQMSDTFFLGSLLGFTGGFLDAYTYISRGHVFAYAQTGNMVLLALNAAEGAWQKAVSYLFPILAFILGIVVAELVRKRVGRPSPVHWRQVIVAAEVAVLLAVAFLPQEWNLLATLLISFLSAMQVEAFRTVNGDAFASTMCTGNLRSGTELLWRFSQTKDRSFLRRGLQYYGIILFFILGAGAGSFLTFRLMEKTAFFGCLLLAVVFALMFVRIDKAPGEKA